MALAKKCDRCGVLYEHYSDFNSYMMTMINTDKHGHISATSKRYDLCPECMRSLTNFMEAPQKEIGNSKDVITPKLITELVGYILNECVLDGHARKLLNELYQTALNELKCGG